MEKLSGASAIYPGTFDPLTNGHLSLVRRGLDVFDTIVVAVAKDSPKNRMFSLEERQDRAREIFKNDPRVIVESFDGLLVEYARRRGARAILRGLRAVSDFEYEFQMALMNRRMNRTIQTVFLMTDYKGMFLSSTLIKEVVQLGGEVQGLVPDLVLRRLKQKMSAQGKL